VRNSRPVHADFGGRTHATDTVVDMNRSHVGSHGVHRTPRVLELVGIASETFDRFPGASRVGLVVIVLAVVADLVAHTTPGLDYDHGGVTGSELSAHAAIFLGMVLVLAGVVVDGALSTRRIHNRSHAGRASDAVR
jgi:hypothetical protein